MWHGSASVVSWSWEKYSCQSKLVSALSMLLLPGEDLRLGTLISYKWAQVFEACDCLKLLSIYFDLCVDATGVFCHQRISRILELRKVLLSIQTGFSLINAAVVCAILESISCLEPSSFITEPMITKDTIQSITWRGQALEEALNSYLERTRPTVTQTDTGTILKATLGKLLRDRVEHVHTTV